jgi:hypothetical protein
MGPNLAKAQTLPRATNRGEVKHPSSTNGTKVTTRSMGPNPAKAQTLPRATNRGNSGEVKFPTTMKVLSRPVVCPVV